LNVVELLTQARADLFDQVLSLKEKNGTEIGKYTKIIFTLMKYIIFGKTKKLENKVKETELNKLKLISDMTYERNEISKLLILQKNFDKLKELKNESKIKRMQTEFDEMSNKLKKAAVDGALILEQKQSLILQQKQAIKKQLAKLDADYTVLNLKLEKEVYVIIIINF